MKGDGRCMLSFNQAMAAMMLNINHPMIPMMLVMILMKTEELLECGKEGKRGSRALGGTTSQPAFEGSQPIKVRRDRRMKMMGMIWMRMRRMMMMRMMMMMMRRRRRRRMKLYFLAWQL